jgi:hypothetical protein
VPADTQATIVEQRVDTEAFTVERLGPENRVIIYQQVRESETSFINQSEARPLRLRLVEDVSRLAGDCRYVGIRQFISECFRLVNEAGLDLLVGKFQGFNCPSLSSA